MSKIKTHETLKNIKTLDRAAVATERMKDSFVRSKETAAKMSDEGHSSPSEYAGDQVQYTAENGVRDAVYIAVEEGKKLAVKSRDAIRNRSADVPDDSPYHFFGSSPEESVADNNPHVERGRVYAKQNAQTRDSELHRQPKTLDQSVISQPSIKTSETAVTRSDVSPSEQGRQLAQDQMKIKTKETQIARASDLQRMDSTLVQPAGRQPIIKSPESVSAMKDVSPSEQGRHLALEQMRIKVKERQAARVAAPHREARTLEQSVDHQPTIKTPESTTANREVPPSEQGRQLAVDRMRIKTKETQINRTKDSDRHRLPKTSEQVASKQSPSNNLEAISTDTEASQMEQGRKLALDRAKTKAKESQLAKVRDVYSVPTHENPSNLSSYHSGGNTASIQSGLARQRENPIDAGRVKSAKKDSIRKIRQRDRSIKRSSRYLRSGESTLVLNSRRFKRKPVKTAEHTSRATIKTAQITAIRGRQAAQSTAVTIQKSIQASRAAKVAAVTTAKAVSKAVATTARAMAAAARSLASAVAAGGSVAAIIIVILCLIGLIAGSCYGILFASEDSGTGLTMISAITQINGELSDRIEKVKEDYEGRYDEVQLINTDSITNWPDVIAIYAVKTTTDRDDPEEVATMTQKKLERLREICWDMNPISAKLVSDEESTILQITMTPKSYTEMMDEYDFNENQRKQVKELMESGLLDKYRGISPDGLDEDFIAIEGTGGYIWPLEGYTRISSPFGYRICPFHGRELHGGVDIPAPYGTAVHAAKSGTVVISTYGNSYGNYIVLAHGDGTRTLYAHMSARLVSPGQTVSQGQTIGRVGSTGSSTGNHLHFETWTGSSSSTRVNPMLYF